MTRIATTLAALAALAAPRPAAADIDVEEIVLENGMTFLLVPRTIQRHSVAVGWVAHVGSVDERPGMTGISHFFEHMMFKGTHTIGTSDPDADRGFRERQEVVRAKLLALQQGAQYDRYRAGEIDDPWDPDHDTEEMRQLRAELKRLMEDHKAVIVKDELFDLYSRNGAVGLNAFTMEDLTFYHTSVPSNRVELWAWLESDRLGDPVFREFYSERDVVHEERRMRVESSPTGELDEQIDATFWASSPYTWPVIGWPSDLESYTMEQAQAYFDTYYAPNNLTAVMVGDFDPEVVKPLIHRYFGTLPRGPDAPPVVTLEIAQLAEKRVAGECDCPPRFQAMYQAPPAMHPDSDVLSALGEILNGRTGRLHEAFVESELATSAVGWIDARKHAGRFVVSVSGREGLAPAQLEAVWEKELARLQREGPAEDELQRVKNDFVATYYRSVRSNERLMTILGFLAHYGDWSRINTEAERMQAITTADVQRAARTWFEPHRRLVAHTVRRAGTEIDAELAALDLPPEALPRIEAQLDQIASTTDQEQLAAMLAEMRAQASKVPEPLRPAFTLVVKRAEARLAVLGGE